jgi:hypothetical protein
MMARIWLFFLACVGFAINAGCQTTPSAEASKNMILGNRANFFSQQREDLVP